MMVQPFWVFVLRNFFAGLPNEIIESAYRSAETGQAHQIDILRIGAVVEHGYESVLHGHSSVV